MNEVEVDKTNLGAPCYECPHCHRRRWWHLFTGSLCGHPLMRHTVSGEAYQECGKVRTYAGGTVADGGQRMCLGYFPNEHAVRWHK